MEGPGPHGRTQRSRLPPLEIHPTRLGRVLSVAASTVRCQGVGAAFLETETTRAVTEPLRLTDLRESSPGLRRAAHGYSTSGTWKRVVFRVAMVAREVLAALPRDILRTLRSARQPPRMQDGVHPAPNATRIALYVHYSATGQVSEMVRYQLDQLTRFGFAIVFISMAARIPEDDWNAVRASCALVVQRENFGRDFGAWHELMPEVRRRWPHLDELLLANDSVLGPIHPMAPVMDALRSDGDGLFGLTESLQGGPHLQSYFLLTRGTAAVCDLMDFLQALYVSHSKWLLVQTGEIRLARWMRRRGHRVAAVFGYERLVRAAVADPAELKRLTGSHAKMQDIESLPTEKASALLHEWPLNPTQHLWHVLATKFGDPFVKTELVLRNPGRLPGVEQWPAVVAAAAPCPLAVLQAHLATMNAG
ncbi:MAG: hypothetical protein QOG73_1344 [Acetobacteraceae bacterium]|nr:hypothetical protein [Acetobacteraceae bacterium]